jgi:hypothetical protein
VRGTKQDAVKGNRFLNWNNGSSDVIYDVPKLVDNTVTWIQKFVAIGDIVVSFDPVHAALPWATFKMVLQVSFWFFRDGRLWRQC